MATSLVSFFFPPQDMFVEFFFDKKFSCHLISQLSVWWLLEAVTSIRLDGKWMNVWMI